MVIPVVLVLSPNFYVCLLELYLSVVHAVLIGRPSVSSGDLYLDLHIYTRFYQETKNNPQLHSGDNEFASNSSYIHIFRKTMSSATVLLSSVIVEIIHNNFKSVRALLGSSSEACHVISFRWQLMDLVVYRLLRLKVPFV